MQHRHTHHQAGPSRAASIRPGHIDLSAAARLALCGVGALALVAGLAGCRGDRTDAPPRQFFPDMDDQPRWDPQEKTDFFTDGRTGRPEVPNTVAFGMAAFDPTAHADEAWAAPLLAERAATLAEDDALYRGYTVGDDGTKTYTDVMPVRVTDAMLARGEERFNIYCSVCHGFQGDGKGMVGQKWSYPVANLLDVKYQDRTQQLGKDGYLFSVIREGVWGPDGVNKMPAYSHALDAMDAWAVLAHLRVLQVATGASAAAAAAAAATPVTADAEAPIAEPAAAESGGATPVPPAGLKEVVP